MESSGSTANLADKSATDAKASDEKDSKKNFSYALVKVNIVSLTRQFCDMSEEVRSEAVDSVVTAIEKYPGNYEAAAKNIKETMDKKCGSSWHVVVGEGYGFEITHEMKNLLYLFFGGNLVI
jgi:dynein light chain 4